MKSQLAIIFMLFSNTFSHPVNNDNPSQSIFYKYYPYSESLSQLVKRRRRRTQPEVEIENKSRVKDKSGRKEKELESTVTLAPSSYPTSSV
jgi:hypothetical protein